MKDVIVGRHFDVMKDGALVCNTGHYDCEINLVDLEAPPRPSANPLCQRGVHAQNGNRVYVWPSRLVNLAAAEGHRPRSWDMSFANQ